MYVNIDDVLNLFGCEDEDIYAKGEIEDALYSGALKTISMSKTVHGQWIEIKSNEFPYNNYVGCSVCKKEAKKIVVGGKLYLDKWYDEYDYFKSEYCPHCGADMRKKNES